MGYVITSDEHAERRPLAVIIMYEDKCSDSPQHLEARTSFQTAGEALRGCTCLDGRGIVHTGQLHNSSLGPKRRRTDCGISRPKITFRRR